MPVRALQEVFDQKSLVITAHRGWSVRFPENTLMALTAAAGLSVDLIEFDLRATLEGDPILLHDAVLDRTTDGCGSPHDYTLQQLTMLNASYWQGSHHSGHRRETPTYANCPIPTFEAVLKALSGRIGMNIQIKEKTPAFLERVCALYARYNLYKTSYLTLDDFAVADLVRSIDKDVAVCVLQERSNIERHVAYGCVACQPRRNEVTPELCRCANAANMPLNMFWVDDGPELEYWAELGLSGVLTNAPDVIQDARSRIVQGAQ